MEYTSPGDRSPRQACHKRLSDSLRQPGRCRGELCRYSPVIRLARGRSGGCARPGVRAKTAWPCQFVSQRFGDDAPMTWLVKVALDRPYTFIVMALMILIFGPLAALRTPTDIFPNIGIPVVGVAFNYAGLSPDEMGAPHRDALRAHPLHHRERCRAYRKPVHAGHWASSRSFSSPMWISAWPPRRSPRRPRPPSARCRPGTQPPFIINYSASTVPVLQMAFSSKTPVGTAGAGPVAEFRAPPPDHGAAARPCPVPMAASPAQVQIDLDPQAMQARGLSATDVQNAFANQNQIMPAGNIKIGSFQYVVKLNNAADTIEAMNDLPVKTVEWRHRLPARRGHVRDGNPPQTEYRACRWRRAVLSTVLKNGQASTLDVVQGHQGPAAAAQAAAARRAQDRRADRPVAVREGGDQRRGARRRHRRRPDQPDDPVVPGQLALHRHHRHLHPAGGAVRR